MEKNIEEIIDREIEMLNRAQNCGGCACHLNGLGQDISIRSSYFEIWDSGILNNYLEDLRTAHMQGRNLLCEKYAYIMTQLDPEEFESHVLPQRSIEKEWLVDWICAAILTWKQEVDKKQNIFNADCGTRNSDIGNQSVTMFEIYLRGEFFTYSVNTLRSYAAYIEKLQKAGKNLLEMFQQKIATKYGRDSFAKLEYAWASCKPLCT